jgi:hypothetical protein
MAEIEFIKIADAKNVLKGSFRGIIIKSGDLKSGTSNGKDWTKKIFTIQDDSGDADLVAWGDEIANFKVGYKYEITNPWWKTYEGKVSVSVGNYGNSKVIGAATEEETAPPSKEQTTLATSSVNCLHGLKEQKDYICKKCVSTIILGFVEELEKARKVLDATN